MSIFKQGTFQTFANMTPAQIETKRQLMAAMMPKYGDVDYVGEGLGQLFTGIARGAAHRKLDKAEGEGRKTAEEAFKRLFGTANSAGSADVQGPLSVLGVAPITPVDPSNPEAIASDAMTALGKGATAEGIKAGLVARGMPEHIAEGFVMNFQDESGLNPAINEVAPLVPGSRGGFGLAQWTGPRRKALEAFAAERGMPVSDPGVQMDFLMTELQGPEAAAWSKISGAGTSGEAAAAIVNNFLRPAEEHRTRREAAYLGGAAPSGGQGGIPMAELQLAMANPWLMSDPGMASIIQAEFQRQTQQADPMYQLQLQKAQLDLEKAQQPEGPPEEFSTRMFTLNSLGIDPQSEEGKVYLMTGKLPEKPDVGYRTLSPEEVAQLGLPPGAAYQVGADGKISQIGGGGTNVTVNNGGGPELGKLSTDYGYVLDPETGMPRIDPATGLPVAAPVPGSPAANEAAAAAKKAELAGGNAMTATDVVTSAAARAREAAKARSVGGIFGQVAAINPSSPNAELYRQVEVLKSNAKIENLTSMRAASPTGGALGSVTEKESEMLAAKSGALDPASPNFERDLDDYERTLLRIVHGKEAGDAIFDATRDSAAQPDADGWQTLPNGVKVRVKQ
jgi:hypothetical protein